MKKFLSIVFVVGLMGTVALAPRALSAASSERSITGVGSGTFASGTMLGLIKLSSFETAAGAFVENGGPASGVFHAGMSGRTLLGAARSVTIDGIVTSGSVSANDQGTLSGIATINDGVTSLAAVPFSVNVNGNALTLDIQGMMLPATFSEGGLAID